MTAEISDRLAAVLAGLNRGQLVRDLGKAYDVASLLAAAARHAADEPDLPSPYSSWLCTEQVAEKLGVTPGTVARMCRPGGRLAPIASRHLDLGARRATWRIDSAGFARILAESRSEGRNAAGQRTHGAA
jgi:hypothetical protein